MSGSVAPGSRGLGPASRRPSRVTPFRGTLPPDDATRVLDISGVNKRFGDKIVLEDVSFHVPIGEFLCLSGPNGAGKSTLLKCILGLLEPDSGTIRIAGLPVEKGRSKIGYVPQRKAFDRDFPASPMEVIVANLRGRWPMKISSEEKDIAIAMLKRTGAEAYANAQMRDLSGGETQRVFLARALATKPELLVLDEPTAGVDVGGRAAIIDLMAEISASDSIAAILVTHNLQAIARCAERVVYLERTVKAWGLWSELSGDQELTAIQLSGDHKALQMDGD
ncbi:MAG: ABC transporter ATP-binding protein [Labilithrix sp.]|nr:ABC transporter ATP-binding protein [Labilithrix sp.]MCW5818232.1 ABC transporter ATP-binding protein [Labilithrix sp.]